MKLSKAEILEIGVSIGFIGKANSGEHVNYFIKEHMVDKAINFVEAVLDASTQSCPVKSKLLTEGLGNSEINLSSFDVRGYWEIGATIKADSRKEAVEIFKNSDILVKATSQDMEVAVEFYPGLEVFAVPVD